MRTIELTRGKIAFVDDADYEWLAQFRWHAVNTSTKSWYAQRTAKSSGVDEHVYMHRQILGISDAAVEGEHRDRNGLNNQRYNLRIATRQQNSFNMGLRSDNTSGFHGVSWDSARQKWSARITTENGYKYLGRFNDKEQAAKAYAIAAIQIHGEFILPELVELAGL